MFEAQTNFKQQQSKYKNNVYFMSNWSKGWGTDNWSKLDYLEDGWILLYNLYD